MTARRRKIESPLLEQAEGMKPILQVPIATDLRRQIKMLNITEEDLAIAQLLKPYVEKHSHQIVNMFYENLKHNQNLIDIINRFGSTERHKEALRKHIIDMFTGIIDDNFFKRREVIANVHLKVGLTQEWYTVSFEKIFRSLIKIVQKYFNTKENIYVATQVINQLINLEIQVVLSAYHHEMRRLREKEVQAQHELVHMAYHDDLTGLPKRNKITEELFRLIFEYDQENGEKFAVINMEVEHVRLLGGSFHNHSKSLFLAIKDRITKALCGINHQLGKLDGLEFVIIVEKCGNEQELMPIVKQLINSMKHPLQFDKREIYLTTSLGISQFPNDGGSPEQLLRYANLAMFEQKKAKKNGYFIFTPQLKKQIMERVNLEDYLRKAIHYDELELHYQPQIDSTTNKLIGLEALVRWNHPKQGMIPPNKFIPIAEETGIIYDISKWVIKEACKHVKEWHNKKYPKVPVWVNISSFQFYEPNLVSNIRHILETVKLDPQFLGLEITESVMMNTNISEDIINELSKIGVQISLDDFGTGYSSLSYLHRLPVHGLKIDRSFIMNITENKNNKAIVSSIITLAKQLQLKIIAEGVETKEQLKFLNQLNCHMIQGYYYSRPLPKDRLEEVYLTPFKETIKNR